MSFFCSTIQFSVCFKLFSATPGSGVSRSFTLQQAPSVPMELGRHRHSVNLLACVDWLVQHHALPVKARFPASAVRLSVGICGAPVEGLPLLPEKYVAVGASAASGLASSAG
jgi:hypothetical protein